ncbi:MAG: 5-dehydro-4-deoxy-D-glucuronate isomerase [Bacteroidota bacterium]
MSSAIRFSTHPDYVKTFDTSALREHFLIQDLLQKDNVRHVYTMHDRMIIMGMVPTTTELALPVLPALTKADYFLERREMGVINIGAEGQVLVDGKSYHLKNLDCLYVGKGARKVSFKSLSEANPAEFYINSLPSHKEYPTEKATQNDANQVALGSKENCNERVIFQYIHEEGIQSCQLVMGFTSLKPGSIWNTFPPHTHYRRMEIYFYFDLPEHQTVMHFMGDPEETRHIVMRNKEAVISPEWSIHSGAGTSSYSFIWSMGGENKAFTDMDAADLNTLK